MKSIRNTVSIPTTGILPSSTVRPLPSTDPASSTAKPLKASKSLFPGLQTELFFSQEFHATGLPLLVSSTLLRSRHLGQIDLARLCKDKQGWIIEIGEVKSSQMGEQQMEKNQKIRLWNSQKFLASLFGHRTKLLRMTKKDS